jgi:hypothetical protein
VPTGHHAPAGDDADAVAQPLDELQLVAGEDDRHPVVGLAAQHAAHHLDRRGVQPGERLVEDEHLRVVHQRRGELDALLVAQRQLLHLVAEAVADAEHVRPAPHGGGGVRGAHAVQPGQVGQLLAPPASSG